MRIGLFIGLLLSLFLTSYSDNKASTNQFLERYRQGNNHSQEITGISSQPSFELFSILEESLEGLQDDDPADIFLYIKKYLSRASYQKKIFTKVNKYAFFNLFAVLQEIDIPPPLFV